MPAVTEVVVRIVWSDVAIVLGVLVGLLALVARLRKPRPGLSPDGKVLTLTPQQWNEMMREARVRRPGTAEGEK